MEKNEKMIQFHKGFAANLFNKAWDLLEKKELDDKEKETLIAIAHASYFHWSQVCNELNLQRGQWMLSNVYSFLKMPEPALYHAKRCLYYTEKNDFKDFDLAYCHEAMARSAAANNNKELLEKHFDLALKAIEQIEKGADRKQFEHDLKNGNWFGLK